MLSFGSFAWLVCSIWVSLGALFVSFPNLTPSIVLHLYVYGKIRKGGGINSNNNSLLLPKSYFSHFYFVGILCITAWFVLCLYVTCGEEKFPQFVDNVIEFMRYPTKESYGDMFSNLLVLACANFQVIRRFLECLLVSVYSPQSKMSYVIYLVGVGFYAAVPVTSISGTNLNDPFKCTDLLKYFCWNHIVGIGIFIWSSWQQNRVSVQFAKLRQNKSGTVENTRHHIPHGGLFEYVSCPHYFTEILIYFSMTLMSSFQNTMFVYMFIFVLVNQLISGHFSHKWYLEHFPKYPKSRKSTIPFIF
ncbi:Steroid 5 alpha-reductase 3 [Mactra antiquata]